MLGFPLRRGFIFRVYVHGRGVSVCVLRSSWSSRPQSMLAPRLTALWAVSMDLCLKARLSRRLSRSHLGSIKVRQPQSPYLMSVFKEFRPFIDLCFTFQHSSFLWLCSSLERCIVRVSYLIVFAVFLHSFHMKYIHITEVYFRIRLSGEQRALCLVFCCYYRLDDVFEGKVDFIFSSFWHGWIRRRSKSQ